MEGITSESLLFQVDSKLTEAKKEKAHIMSSDKNDPKLPSLNARIGSLVLIKSELIRKNQNHVYLLTKSNEIGILNNMAETRKENVKVYSDNGKPELAEAEYQEQLVIEEFLPKMPTEDKLKEFIANVIDTYVSEQNITALSMKDMGKIKPLVNATYPTVSGNIIKDVLMSKINGE